MPAATATTRTFGAQALRERDQAGLGRAVDCGAGRRAHARDAGDEDDHAALGLLLHGRVRALRAVERHDQVQLDDLLVEAR
jgi:hypothetical protein